MKRIGQNSVAVAPVSTFVAHVLLAVLLTPSSLQAQQQNTTFESLTIDDGLSTSFVTTILQDRKGFIWIGTQDGLNRYDGYDFRIFRSIPGDTLSLSSSSITTIFEDSRGRIWIGTRNGGINYYDPGSDRFTSFRYDPEQAPFLSNGTVRAILEDLNGYLWIGTDNGLYRLTNDALSVDAFYHDPADPHSLAGDSIWALTRSSSTGIWVGTDKGVCLLDPQTLSFTCFPNQLKNFQVLDTVRPPTMIETMSGALWIGTSEGLSILDPESGGLVDRHQMVSSMSSASDKISSLYRGGRNEVWVGTDHGLTLYETDTGTFSTFHSIPGDPRSLLSDNITAEFEDRTGVFWVGTDKGISKSNPGSRRVRLYSSNPSEPTMGLGDNHVWSIFEDRTGCVWFGSDAGLDCYHPGEGYIHHFRHDPNDSSSLSHNVVMTILESRAGELLVGTRGGGLNRLDRDNGRFIHYRHDPGNPNSISSDFIYRIHEDADGIIWLASGNGLNRFDPRTGGFRSFRNTREALVGNLSDNDIWALIEDHRGYLLLGTWGSGLFQFNRATAQFTFISNTLPESDTPVGTNILSLFEDSSGIVWIGALDGLHRFDPETEEFTHFSTSDGLPNNVIYGILEDEVGRLWLSTNRGLSRFEPERSAFSNYDVHNGLQSNEFDRGAYMESRTGELYFGGINGVSAFYPKDMIYDDISPLVSITELTLNNVPVPIGPGPDGRTILTRSISDTDVITLSYSERNISLSFTGLHFVAPDQIEYAYEMTGVDRSRNNVGNQRYARYSNLSPGEHVFRVYAANQDGVWNEEGASLRIIITPPFTMTWWFRSIIVMAFLAAIVGVIQYRTRAIRNRNILLEQRVTERTAELETANMNLEEEVGVRIKTEEKLQEQIEERLRLELQIQQAQKLESLGVLAGGIAHDFNNLLTGVLGNAELALMKLPEDTAMRRSIEAIQSSAKKAADLSMQMLAYSGKGFFKFKPLDLSSVIEQMIPQIEHLLPDQIDLKTALQPDLPFIQADSSQITQAVMNLVINAVEAIDAERGVITILTGSDIFNRQYLSETYLDEKLPEGRYAYVDVLDTGCGMEAEALTRIFDPFYSTKFAGRGLGLAATLGIIRGHMGAVRVDSILGHSTHFRLLFPVAEAASEPARPPEESDRHDRKGATILLVDDEASVLEIGTSLLESLDLEVIQASGGVEAIDLFARHSGRINLVIVDMSMPGRNGVEVMEEIRRIDTDIPVIISSGYPEGALADALTDELPSGFIQKPYTRAILMEMVEPMLRQRS